MAMITSTATCRGQEIIAAGQSLLHQGFADDARYRLCQQLPPGSPTAVRFRYWTACFGHAWQHALISEMMFSVDTAPDFTHPTHALFAVDMDDIGRAGCRQSLGHHRAYR